MVRGIGPREGDRGAYMARVLDSHTIEMHHHFREQLRRIGSLEALDSESRAETKTLFEKARKNLEGLQQDRTLTSNSKIKQILARMEEHLNEMEQNIDNRDRYQSAAQRAVDDHKLLETEMKKISGI